MTAVPVLALGGPELSLPMTALTREGRVDGVLKELGLKRMPDPVSPGGALQLLRMLSGELVLPADIVPLLGLDEPVRATDATHDTLRDLGALILEIRAGVEYVVGDVIISPAHLHRAINQQIAALGPDIGRLHNLYRRALTEGDERGRSSAVEGLLAVLPIDTDAARRFANLLSQLRSRPIDADGISAAITAIRKLTLAPLGITLTPEGDGDGGDVAFRAMVPAIAARRGVPVFDPTALVRAAGAETARDESGRRWAAAFVPEVADALFGFIDEVIRLDYTEEVLAEVAGIPAEAVAVALPGDGERRMILSFGGCTLNNPLNVLFRRQQVALTHREMGFRRTPYALSANAMLQLMRFCRGDIVLPEWVRFVNYVDVDHQPRGQQCQAFAEADLVLLEFSTPTEYYIGDYVFNHNRFNENVIDPLKHMPDVPPKLISRYRANLQKMNHDARAEAAEALLRVIPGGSAENDMIRHFLRETQSRMATIADIRAAIAGVREHAEAPAAIVLHNFHYMPDGRPVVWPPDFNEQIGAVAREFGLPVLDPATLVAKHGVAAALAPDLRHWKDDFYGEVADALHAFIAVSLNG